MRFLFAATILGTASAFLLPPTISADKDVANALPFEVAAAADGRVMDIACIGCPVEIKDIQGNINAVTSQVESALRLDFSIAHGVEGDQLMLNGLQLYPLDDNSLRQEILTADQLVKAPDGTWNYVGTPGLGFGFSIHHDHPELVEINVQVFNVGGKFIDGMSTADLKILETPSGKLMIGDAQISPAKVPESGPAAIGQECTNFICKWKAIVAAKLAQFKAMKLKGCAGKSKIDHPLSGHRKPGHRAHGHGSRPHGVGFHGSHRPQRHQRHGSFARFIRRVIFHVFVPVLIGVVVGITASLIGMVVGHFAIFLYRTVFRRAQYVQYQNVEQDESKFFMEHQGPPPVYEDAPACEAMGDEKAA